MSNVNVETGIRYGVISGHSVPLLVEDIIASGTDETFEAHKRECIKTVAAALEECGQRDAEDQAKAIVDDFEWDDYQAEESEYSWDDGEGNKFLLGYLGGAPLVWCVKTTAIVHVRSLCSPCVPNAGDLDSGIKGDGDGYECYGVPKEYL